MRRYFLQVFILLESDVILDLEKVFQFQFLYLDRLNFMFEIVNYVLLLPSYPSWGGHYALDLFLQFEGVGRGVLGVVMGVDLV